MELSKLYSPISIKGKTIRNRIVLAPMGTRSSLLDGSLTDRAAVYLEERAKGGAGLIIPELTAVREGYTWIPSLQIYADKLIPTLSRLTDSIHAYGSLIVMQLALHGGRAASKVTGKPCIAPSSIDTCLYKETPVELKEDEIYELIEDWTSAAVRAKRAGFDGVEVHGSHGYLINQFISPHTNKRTDKWGGSLKNRLRFAELIIKSIMDACGDDFIVGFKFSAYEHLENGITEKEAIKIGKYIEGIGVDYLHVAATSSTIGGHSYCEYPSVPSMYDSSNVLAKLSESVKKEVNIPVIATAGISDPEDGEDILRKEQADMVAIGRGFLAEAYWGLKPQLGEKIRPCIRCNVCHNNVLLGKNTVCAVNPGLLREYRDLNEIKVKRRKKLLIIGSGPAGLETAIQAKDNGHEVVIYEKDEFIGGALRLAGMPDFKYRVKKLMEYYLNEIDENEINIITSCELNEANILSVIEMEKPDLIVVATGGLPFIPKINGINNDNVFIATDVIEKPLQYNLGDKVVVMGAGKVGLELAWYLSEFGKKVTVVEMMKDEKLLKEEHPTTYAGLLHNLEIRNVKIICGCKVKRILKNSLDIVLCNGVKESIDADSTVIATGFVSNNKIISVLNEKGYINKVFVIGDCKQVRGMRESISEGYFLGKYIV